MQLLPSLVDRPLLALSFGLTLAIFAGNLAALGYWARAEAAARDGSPAWTFVSLFSGFGLLRHVWIRHVQGDWGSRSEPAGRRERLVTAYSLAVLLAFVVGALVTPPDPVAQVVALPPLFAGAFVLSYLFVTRRAGRGPGETPT